MGFAERVIARAAPEQRAITEWGSSAIPGPLGNLTGGGGSYSSIDLRRAEASLQKVAVWSAVDLIAGVASQLPLQTFQTQPDGTGKLMPSNPQLVEDPGGEDQGAGDWIYQYLASKLLRGNAYGKLASFDTRYNTPTQIVLYHPDDVSGYRDPTSGVPVWRVNGRDIPQGSMWHRRAYPSPGQLLGLSPVGQHATTIGQGIAAARFGQQFFTDGGHPTAVVQNSEEEIDQKKAVEVKARWTSAVWGSREPVVMGRGWDFKPLSISPDESQFLETQKFTGAECCRIFGPNIAEILGYETGSSMTYANQEQRAIDFLKFTLNRWLRDVEMVFTKYLPKPQYVRFNRKTLLETDLLTRYQAHQTARQIGLNNIDELRAEEDLSPLPNGQGQDYTPLLVQVAASRGIDAAQVHAGQPASDQPLMRSAEPGPKGDRADEARKFNPAEPRNPDGTWGSLGAHVAHEVHKLGDSELHLHAHADQPGSVTLTHGDRSVTLNEREAELLGRHLERGQHEHVGMRYQERPEGGHVTPLYRVTHGGEDEEGIRRQHLLTLAHPDDSHEELTSRPGVSMTDSQAEHLSNGLNRMTEARRVDTGNGPMDIIPQHDAVGFRMKDEHGKPIEVSFPVKDWARIDHAINLALEGFDDLDPNGPELSHLTVQTSHGPVDIDWRGPRQDMGYDPHAALTITPGYDAPWSMAVDGAHMHEVFDRMGWASEAAGVDTAAYPGTNPKWLTVRTESRAAGVDTHPGDADRLHEYWTKGEGLAKWANSLKPWTTLVSHLVKFMPLGEAKRTAAEWFHDVFHFWPGSDANRVTHGKPPRGKRVGPG